MADLSVNLAGVELKNPIIPASGCFGYGREYENFYDLSLLGGISVKGMTLNKRDGNPPPRIAETPGGILNSVGLQNPGIDHFLDYELPYLSQKGTVIIANVAGSTIEDCAEIAKRIEQRGQAVDMIELNVSCPNVKAGGVAFGVDPAMAEKVTAAVRRETTKPLMVKLSPNVTDITEIAKAAESAGADAVSLINTILGMRIDIKTKRPVLKNNTGGLSGPAVLPVAVRMVWQVANSVNIPVCGMGGVSRYEDVVELMLAGATAVQIGASMFNDPLAPITILNDFNAYLDKNNISAMDLVGQVKPY